MFNWKLCLALEEKGISVYLPQRDTNQKNRPTIYHENKSALDRSNIVIAVAQNESPNWGVEVGYAFASNKPVIGISATNHEIPLMAHHMLTDIVKTDSLDTIENYINELINVINKYVS